MCRRDNLFVIKYNETDETIIIVPVSSFLDVNMGLELSVLSTVWGVVKVWTFFGWNEIKLEFKF